MKEQKKKKVTVSADDFGISENASAKILELVRMGKIDRVAVMMSKNITKEYVKILLNSGVKIDIHFHLAKDKLDRWQDRKEEYVEGNLKRIAFFILNYFFGKNKIDETKNEWNIQLDYFRKIFGRYPDGVGSHEHIHFFPVYFKIITDIASQNNIEFVRFGKNKYKQFNPVSLILNFLRFFDFKYFKGLEPKIKTTDFFVSFDWIKNFNKSFKDIPAGKEIELVFHPERPSEFEFLKNFSEE